LIATFRLTSTTIIRCEGMQPGFQSGAVTRPLSAFLRLAMMGCYPALRAREELAAGACATVLGRCRCQRSRYTKSTPCAQLFD